MTTTNTYTNLSALNAVLDGKPIEGALRAKLTKMAASEAGKKARAAANRSNGTESKEKIQNRNTAIACVRAIAEAGNEPRNSTWLMERVNGLLSPQAVAGKMNIARANGWVAYSGEMVDKKRAWYVTDAGFEMLAN